MTTSARFAFGENWRDFASSLDDHQISQARASLARLIPADEIAGKTFVDIGCGSGLHALAALQAGAVHLECIDYDPVSVETTRRLLETRWPGKNWSARQGDILAIDTTQKFDIVYSWGVLHHTGDVRRAIRNAAAMVAPSGLFVIAIYTRTPFCWAWKIIKRAYNAAPEGVKGAMVNAYLGLLRAYKGQAAFDAFVKTYAEENRGMSVETNAKDWLGGYPYESMRPSDVRSLVSAPGFAEVFSHLIGRVSGVFGSGCDEYVFRAPG